MRARRMIASGLAVALAALLAASPVLAEAPDQKVNINTATIEELVALPGVGPTLAGRIVEYREKAGQFNSVEELLNVKGIGEKNFEKIADYLTVGEPGRKRSK